MTKRKVIPEPLELNKMTLAQQMAEKAYDASKVNTEATIPTAYKQHWKVLSEKEARQRPPHCSWDHEINLKEMPDNAPVSTLQSIPLSFERPH
jgi:hypothetical protein